MKIALRILVSPFIFGLLVVAHTLHVFHRTYLFIRYGGEYIGYNKDDKKTIQDLYIGLQMEKTKEDLEQMARESNNN